MWNHAPLAVDSLLSLLVLDLDPFSDANLRDPYPFYDALLAAGPAIYMGCYGFYAVGRCKEVGEVASDHRCFTSFGRWLLASGRELEATLNFLKRSHLWHRKIKRSGATGLLSKDAYAS